MIKNCVESIPKYVIGNLISIKFKLLDCNQETLDTEDLKLIVSGGKLNKQLIPLTRIYAGYYSAILNSENIGYGNFHYHIQARGRVIAATKGQFIIVPSPSYVK